MSASRRKRLRCRSKRNRTIKNVAERSGRAQPVSVRLRRAAVVIDEACWGGDPHLANPMISLFAEQAGVYATRRNRVKGGGGEARQLRPSRLPARNCREPAAGMRPSSCRIDFPPQSIRSQPPGFETSHSPQSVVGRRSSVADDRRPATSHQL